MNIHKVFSI